MHIGSNTLKKLCRRGSAIVLNSLYFLLVPVLNFALYFLVLHLSNATVWGHLVELLLIVNLVVHVISWGGTPYLLRAFSQDPARIPEKWQEAFFPRLAFVVIPAILFLIFYPLSIGIWLAVWLALLLVYRALEVFIIYLKKFRIPILAEVAGFAVLAGAILWDERFLEPAAFAQLYAAHMLIKVVAVMAVFHKEAFARFRFRMNFNYFAWAFPLMIIALVGLLREKIDLYLMALVGTIEELGMYHVLISALNIMKTGAAFLVQPFIKNIYRLPLKALRVITRRMVVAGIIITAVGTLALAAIIPNVFGFYFGWQIYLLGAAAVFPFYYSINFTHRLYRRHQERRMILFAVSGILLNAVLSIALIPAYGVMGALIGTAAAEWLVLIILSIHERGRKV